MWEPFNINEVFHMLRKYDGIQDVENDVEIMQYTGLKDKNGKEIYEGDILLRNGSVQGSSITDMSDPNPDMRIIKWDDNEGRLTFSTIDGRIGISGFSYCKNNLNTLYEVIGNIHENPELL